MIKISNKKGFTLIEVLFSFMILTLFISVTQATLTNMIQVGKMNAQAYADLLVYSGTFESFISGVSTEADVTSLSGATSNRFISNSYSSFDSLITNGAIITTTDFSYADVSGSAYNPNLKDNFYLSVTSFTKSDGIGGGPYYFVVSNITER